MLVCPMCSDVVESFRSLRKLHTHFHCDLCQCDYDAALDDYIKVTFTVSPAVRSIRFHKPDALSAWDYVFHYKLMPDGILPDGVPWSEAAKGLVRALTRIEPGSAANLEVDAAEGALLGQDFESDAQFFVPVERGAAITPPHVPVVLDPTPWLHQDLRKFGALLPEWSPIWIPEEQRTENPCFFATSLE